MQSQQKVLWFAIVCSTVIYALIAFTIAGQPQGTFDAAFQRTEVFVLYGLAVAAFVAAMILPRALPPQARFVATLAIFESCAIFGLVAAFLVRDYRLYVGPWALAVIGFLKAFPQTEADRGTV